MKKKLAVILMSSILAVSSLVGCGSSSASESGTENANTGAAEACKNNYCMGLGRQL